MWVTTKYFKNCLKIPSLCLSEKNKSFLFVDNLMCPPLSPTVLQSIHSTLLYYNHIHYLNATSQIYNSAETVGRVRMHDFLLHCGQSLRTLSGHVMSYLESSRSTDWDWNHKLNVRLFICIVVVWGVTLTQCPLTCMRPFRSLLNDVDQSKRKAIRSQLCNSPCPVIAPVHC